MHVTDIIQQFNPWLKGASVNWGKDLSADLNVAFVGASARSAFKFSLLLYIHSLPLPLDEFWLKSERLSSFCIKCNKFALYMQFVLL